MKKKHSVPPESTELETEPTLPEAAETAEVTAVTEGEEPVDAAKAEQPAEEAPAEAEATGAEQPTEVEAAEDIPAEEEETEPDGNRFTDSIDAYTVKDLSHMERARARTQIASLSVRSLMIAVCIGILGYSVYMIADRILDGQRSMQTYEELRVDENIEIALERSKDLPEPNAMPTVLKLLGANDPYLPYIPGTSTSPDLNERYLRYYRNFRKHASNNPNMYAWIYMSDTLIDYPVMKGDDNDYYLHRDPSGNESHPGSIFAEHRLKDVYGDNRNVVIYGHNMKDGSMFNSLKKWCKNPEINNLVKTTEIEVYTQEGIYIYEILSWYIDGSNYFASTYFASDEVFETFLNKVHKMSETHTTRTYDASSKIITLVTCTNGGDTERRYVVHGLLKKFIPCS